MPWWVTLYFSAYAVFAAFGIWDDLKEKHPRWFVVGDIGNACLLVALALAYWLPGVGQLLEQLSLALYCFAIAWLAVVFRVSLKEKVPNPAYSLRSNVFLCTGFFILLGATAGPLYWWGFQYAVLGKGAGTYSMLKQHELALKDQKASFEIESPQDVWPFVMLGVYYRELKQYDLSLAALKDALKYDEDGPKTGPGMAVYYHTGQTLHAAGRYAEAIEAYTIGIPKQPDYGYALYRRALSYEKLGDKVQAKRDLFRAAELEPKEGYEADIKATFAEYGISVKGGTR